MHVAITNPGPVEFSTTIMSDDKTSGTFIEFPFEPSELFGTTGRVPVRMTVNGAPYRGSLVKYRGRYMVGVPKAVRDAAGAAAGDSVQIVLEVDDAPREVEVPAELAEELARDEVAAAGWDAMSFTHRREYASAIADAKKPETKAKRVAAALAASRERAPK